MKEYLKNTLISVIGLLLGLIIHGLIEIPVIYLLINVFTGLFSRFSWRTWVLIHHILTVVIEVLGLVLAFRIFEKCGKGRSILKQ